MGPESSSHKVTIIPNRWRGEVLVVGGRQIVSQARGRGSFESNRLIEHLGHILAGGLLNSVWQCLVRSQTEPRPSASGNAGRDCVVADLPVLGQ
jgi:hypothetical protein